MKLVVRLGNPENKYNFTRHNFGFLALDYYLKIKKLDWEPTPKFNAICVKTTGAALGQRTTADDQIIFIKPQTYYNDSGSAIAEFARYFKIAPSDIIILCDDFNIPFGTLRYRENGSAGGNNGLKSTIQYLKTESFPRLRLGTGNPALRSKIGDTDFVLGKFTPEEKEKLPEILKEISLKISELI